MNRIILLVILILTSIQIFAQKIKIHGIMIDACGTEQLNEFITLKTVDSVEVSKLKIDFDANNNTGSNQNKDIDGGNCKFTMPSTSSLDSLKKNSIGVVFIPMTVGNIIPQNSKVLVIVSTGLNYPYDLTSFGNSDTVYVLQNSCTRTVGAFTNLSNTNSNRITIIAYNGINQDTSYINLLGTARNGQYGVMEFSDTMKYSNNNIYESYCVNDLVALPVTLVDFKIDCNGYGYFKLLSEYNISEYVLQYTDKFYYWDDILYTSSYNSNEEIIYRFKVNKLKNGYYRLKVIEYSGEEYYTDVISVNCNNTYFYKNNNGKLIIHSNNLEKIIVYDISGKKIVDELLIGEKEYNLPNGIYLFNSNKILIYK